MQPTLIHDSNGPLARLARWCGRRRKTVLAAWVVALVGISVLSGAIGTEYANDSSSGNTESQRAIDLLKQDFPEQSGDTDQIVFRAKEGSLTDPGVRSRIEPMLAEVAKLPHVTGVVSPYSKVGAEQLAPGGEIGFAVVTLDQRGFDIEQADAQRVIDTARAAGSSELQVELGGLAIEQAQQPELGAATSIGLIAAIVVLLITFGSFIAMGLPIVTALLGLGTGIGLISLGTHVIDMPDFSTELAVMIGLGVGIDYALFIVTRFRENRRSGADVATASAVAMDTAGRAVVFAGVTVIIALLGMLALGVSFLNGMAIAAALAVAMTMVAALTALPALLAGKLGEKVGDGQRRRSRTSPSPRQPQAAGFWARWAGFVRRNPWPAAIVGTAIMVLLTVPALSMRLGSSDAGNASTSNTTRRAYDLQAEGFGKGFNGPLQLVAELPTGGAGKDAATAIGAEVGQVAGVASVSPPRISGDGGTAVFQVYPESAPQDEATTDLVKTLRDDSLPPIEQSTGTELLVGGATATQVDFTDLLSSKLPLFIGIVVLLAALLLLVVFRSLIIPVQAALMNLLSIGASVGVVVAIFQWGWLGGLLGISGGPIDSFIPVFLFAIVFGLSMDYEVFLVSRIHEEWTRRGDASQAVLNGLASTGRVITAAAAIMVCVFGSFALGDDRILKMFGISLATAVFLDAFVVRSLLLPAVLELLGRRTWMLPSWLDRRLPHLSIEPEPEVKAEPA